jgi:hypothetical protein
VRATEKSGVSFRGPSFGWAVLLAVLAALAIQLSGLTAIAAADELSLVPAPPDDPGAAPDPGADGTTGETPAPDPVPDPEVISPEPVAPPGPPAATDEPPGPDAADPGVSPPSELDRPELTHAADAAGSAESSTATAHQIDGPTAAVPAPEVPLPTAADPLLTSVLPAVVPESPVGSRGAEPKHSQAVTGVLAVAWRQPGPLVSGVTVHAWGAAVTWGAPAVSSPAPSRAKSPAAASTEDAVEGVSPERAPRVPHPPGGAVCGGASSCASVSLVMLPLMMGIGCLCALLFERLILAPALWRPTRFVSLRERPG